MKFKATEYDSRGNSSAHGNIKRLVITVTEYSKKVVFPVIADYRVNVIITSHTHLSRKKRKSLLGPAEADETWGAFHEHKGNGESWLFLPLASGSGTIAHECWHAIRAMFNYVGIGIIPFTNLTLTWDIELH